MSSLEGKNKRFPVEATSTSGLPEFWGGWLSNVGGWGPYKVGVFEGGYLEYKQKSRKVEY